MQEKSIQSLGGEARAESLSKEERQNIAKKAAEARWNVPKVTHPGELKIDNLIIPCAVLDNGERVLAARTLAKALGVKGGGRYWEVKRSKNGAHLPEFVSAKYLSRFIGADLIEKLSESMTYMQKNGTIAVGIKATLLPIICDIWIKAKENGALKRPSQIATAKKAYLLLKGFAHVGIIALVDEATGYQHDRPRRALAEILEKFIAKELRAWTKTFPSEFYEQIFKLKGWKFEPSSIKRPAVIGHYTNDIVYKRLAPGVLKSLQEKNPSIDGRRKHKHFQWLTGDIGDPKLKSHIDGVLALMRISDDWKQFRQFLKKAYPIYETTELGLKVEVAGKE